MSPELLNQTRDNFNYQVYSLRFDTILLHLIKVKILIIMLVLCYSDL